jgi:hypothetical protein
MSKVTTICRESNFLKCRGLNDWRYEKDTFSRVQNKPFSALRDEVRLKRAMKKAVEREFAPQSLIDSIKMGIRR